MSAYLESVARINNYTGVVTNDVTVFNWTATDTTLTPTRVDTNTANTATGNIVFSATDATAAANAQVAIRALAGIYATATVVAGATADNIVITVLGGYDITWAKTGGTGTITEAGAAGSDTAVAGKVTYTMSLPIGQFAVAKRIALIGFNDNSLDVSIKAGTINVFVKTAVDTSTTAVDAPFVRQLSADGLAGEDGAAAANVSGGVFNGPLAVVIDTSVPIATASAASVRLVYRPGFGHSRIAKRSSGALAGTGGSGDGGYFNLGARFANVKKISLLASAGETSVTPVLTDADGLVFYTKATTDYTTAVVGQLSMEGIDQAGNAIADTCDAIARSPVHVTFGTTLGAAKTFTVTTWSVV